MQTVRNRRRLKDQVEKKGKNGGEVQREGMTEGSKEELGKRKSRKIQLHAVNDSLDPEVSTQMDSN